MFSPYRLSMVSVCYDCRAEYAGQIAWPDITCSVDHQDKYQHPLALLPSTERDQPANVGCYQKPAGWPKSRSVALRVGPLSDPFLASSIYGVLWRSLVVVSVTATTGPRGR